MKKCKLNKKHKCSADKQTKNTCLYCILQRLNNGLNMALQGLDYSIPLPLANAVNLYATINFIDKTYIEFDAWLKRYYPKFEIRKPMIVLTKTFKDEANKTPVV